MTKIVLGKRTELKVVAVLIVFSFLSTILAAPVGDEPIARATAGSPSFGQVSVVNDNKANEQVTPVIVSLPGHGLFMVWQDWRWGFAAIYSSSSFNNGSTWTTNKRVDDPIFNTSMPRDPAVAVTGNGTILIVWQDNRRNTFDYDIFFAKSFNHGATFSRNTRVDDGPTNSWQERPSIVVTVGGTIYVAWTDDRTGTQRVRGAFSTDMGSTFSHSKEIVPSGNGGETGVSLAAYGNTIYAAFMDNVTRKTAHPFSCSSTNGGQSFTNLHRIDDTGRRGRPQNGVSIAPLLSGGFVAAWEDSRNGNSDTYISVIADDGSFVISNLRVEDDSSFIYAWQENPSVAADQLGNIYVVWQDERTTGYPAIRFAIMKSGKTQFNSSIEVAKPGNTDMQMMPSIVVTNPGHVIVSWQDDKGGTNDVYVSNGSFPNLYGLTLVSGWNFISTFLVGGGYKASTLGLMKGDVVVGWNSSRATYDQTFIVKTSPPTADFAISDGSGYWVFAGASETINMNGTVPTAKQTKKVVVPGGGNWAAVGFESFNSSRHASDIPALYSIAGGVTAIAAYDANTGKYNTYYVGFPSSDFKVVPGKAYWIWCKTSGSFNYYP